MRLTRFRVRRDLVGLLGLLVASCGPELTRPAEINLTGAWSTTATIPPITNIQMRLNQSADGTVNGDWSGKSSIANPRCPPDLGLNPANIVTGKNTVLEVSFELLGAGEFEGQVIDSNTIRGSFVSCQRVYAVTFLRSVGVALAATGERSLP